LKEIKSVEEIENILRSDRTSVTYFGRNINDAGVRTIDKLALSTKDVDFYYTFSNEVRQAAKAKDYSLVITKTFDEKRNDYVEDLKDWDKVKKFVDINRYPALSEWTTSM